MAKLLSSSRNCVGETVGQLDLFAQDADAKTALILDQDKGGKCDTSSFPITHIPHYLNSEQCAALRAEASNYPFERPQVHIYGKSHTIPRAQVWFGDEGCDYLYSGLLVAPRPWPKYAARLRDKLIREFGGQYNSLLVNQYNNGHEHMGWHSDDEPELAVGTDILSITLGATRDFVIRHKQIQIKHSFALQEGDLLIMHAPMQDFWQHALPKRLKVKEQRLNYTFRTLVPNYHR